MSSGHDGHLLDIILDAGMQKIASICKTRMHYQCARKFY